MHAPSTEQLRRVARTDWRRLAAWALLTAATAAGLYFGVSETVERRVDRNVIVNRGTPCIRVKSGPERGRPSAGCERLLRLLAETCARRPVACATAIEDTARRLSPRGRRQLARALRTAARLVGMDELRQRRASARRRARARARRRADGRSPPGEVPLSDRDPTTNQPTGPPTGVPDRGGQRPPGPGAPPPRPTPTDVVERILRDPGSALRDPVGTGDELLCSLGQCLPPRPQLPVP